MSIYISRVYTKSGDLGETSLVGGQRVRKDSLRIEAYGCVDELNAVIGLLQKANRDELVVADHATWQAELAAILTRVQSELFNLGSALATLPADLAPTQPRILARHTQQLENEIDKYNESLAPLRSFTIPGGGWTSSYFHLARTVCRRAERIAVGLAATVAGADAVDAEDVRYLNRLSDAFYVWGRFNVRARGEDETLWQPEKSS